MLSSAPTTGWYKYTYIPSTFSLPPHPPHLTPLGHHRAPSWAPRAIQHLATSHLFYTCMCIQLLSHVWPDFMDCSLPSSTVHGIFQATVLQWVAISFSRRSSWAGYWTCISCVCCTGRWVLCHCECQSYSKKDSVLQSPSLGSLSHRKFPSAIYLHMLVYMHPCYSLPSTQGGRFKREGTYVPLWLVHVDVCQKSNQYCKPIINQLKKIFFFKKGLHLQLSW